MSLMRATDIVRRRRRQAARHNRPQRPLWRGLLGGALGLLLVVVVVPLIAVAAGAGSMFFVLRGLPSIYTLGDLPLRNRAAPGTTQLLAWSAATGDGDRRLVLVDEIVDPRAGQAEWIAVDALPGHVVDAWLAANDPAFFTADRPTFAALWDVWRRTGAVAGIRSPIARELIATHVRGDGVAQPEGERQPTHVRALQDWYLGWQLERVATRRQVLEWAMNSRYYGSLAFGIDAAARVYYDRSASELTLGQSAMLAALAADPTANPFDDPPAARRARDDVLAALAGMGAITPAEEAAARGEPLATAAPPGSQALAPRFARHARRELEAILGPQQLLAGGLQVETTLDLAAQEQVDCVIAHLTGTGGLGGAPPCAAASRGPALIDVALRDMAVVVARTGTGEIEALAGDATAPRAMGTLVRPFIYLTALSQGHSVADMLLDVPGALALQDGEPFAPQAPDAEPLGPLRLRTALAADRALPAAEALSWVGVDLVRETALALGLRPDGALTAGDLTFAESGFDATLLDISRAFATLGNGGEMAGAAGSPPRLTTIRRIADGEGREIYVHEPRAERVVAPELAWLMSDILADDDARCAGADCPEAAGATVGRPVARSGGRAASGDDWAVGYAADRLVGVWVADGRAAEDNAAALPWQLLMAWLVDGTAAEPWPRPPALRAVDVCALSGLLPAPDVACPRVGEWFIPGTEPAEFDTWTVEVAINRKTGLLATIFTPPQLIERRIFSNVPPEAAQWAAAAGMALPPTEYDAVGPISAAAGAAELALEPWSTVGGLVSVVGSAGGDDFAYYRLAVFPGLMPERMVNLVERGEAPVESAELALWDTTQVDDGLYTLLLTVVRGDKSFDEVAIPVAVKNGE